MPRAVQLNDGRILRSQGDIPDAAFDAIADAVESGGRPPAGITIEGMDPRDLQTRPMREAYRAASGPMSTVRDVATKAVGYAAQGIAGMAPEAMSLTDALQKESGASPPEAQSMAAQMIAQQVVPQTPDQLVSTLALGGLSGVGGATGALLRVTVPTLMGISTKAVLEEEQDPASIMAQIVGSIVGEGVGPALNQIAKRKLIRIQQDKWGDDYAKVIGEGVAQVSTVKHLRTAENFRMIMGDEGPEKSLFAKEMSKAMDTAENNLSRGLTSEVAKLPPAQRESILAMMEEAAGREPTMKHAIGTPIRSKPTERVFPTPPDTLFKEALAEKRRLFQAADGATGQEKFDMMKLHEAQTDKIRSTLASINPQFADMYKAMNDQFRADMEMRDLLWRMKEAKSWTPSSDRTHFNAAEAASVLSDSMGMAERTGFMGGADKLTQFLSGPSGVPGAMPMSHEGVMRMFLQLIPGAPSLSAGSRTRTVTVPTAPVMASHVKALSDYLATNVIRGMAEGVTNRGEQ